EQHDVVGERATGESRAGAARHESNAAFSEQLHDRDRLLARAGEDGQRGTMLVSGKPVRLVGAELARTLEHATLADDGRECAREEPRARTSAHHHDVETALSIAHAAPERGQLHLALAYADEHERRAIDAGLPVHLQLHREAAELEQDAERGERRREAVA